MNKLTMSLSDEKMMMSPSSSRRYMLLEAMSPDTGMTADGPSPTVTNRNGESKVGQIVGVVVTTVVFLAIVVVLVILWVRRRRRKAEQGGDTRETPVAGVGTSPFPLLESQGEETSPGLWTAKKNRELYESISPRDASKLSPLQSPMTRVSQEVLQISDSQGRHNIYSTSTSSSLSTGDSVQPPIVSLGVKAFAYEELSRATNRFSQNSFLGSGGFGSVYKGFLGDGDSYVAIKVLQTGGFQGDREFLAEINVISRVHHKNLVTLVGYCVSGHERLLVYEFVENNNLAFHLLGTETPVLDWPTRMSIALGAAKGIAYLHEECQPRIVHRDIKSTNILLDSTFRAKVADFGLAKFVPDNQTHVTTRVLGTLGYLAPEFGSSGRLTEKSDVFSFGVVLLELITGRQPINLVEWASPLLDQALEDDKFTSELIDPKLADKYDYEEMNRMVTCAAVSIHRFPVHRPKMSQVVHVLEGNVSSEQLKAETSRSRIRHHA